MARDKNYYLEPPGFFYTLVRLHGQHRYSTLTFLDIYRIIDSLDVPPSTSQGAMVIVKRSIVPMNEQPYETPRPDQQKVRLSVSDMHGVVESLEIIIQAVELNWARHTVRVEGFTYCDNKRCRVIAYYKTGKVDDDLGRIHIYRP